MSTAIKWEALQRLRYIEAKIITCSEFCTNDLINKFGIGRAQATKDISAYLEQSGRIEYDAFQKRYVQSKNFKPVFFKQKEHLRLFVKFMEIF